VALPDDRPFGVRSDKVYRATQVELQPGDRLVLLTDGMLERGAAALDLRPQASKGTRARSRWPG
jgi:serine phosphatase RsbU (regulator of sigma subunit)